MWAKDGPIDLNSLAVESAKIAVLHNKYYRIYADLGIILSKKRVQLKELMRAKASWLGGTMDAGEMKERGWKPNPLRIVKSELNGHVDADKEVIELSLDIGRDEIMLQYVESILKTIGNRSYQINNAIAFQKMQLGIG